MCILYCCEGRKLDNYWVITSPSLNKEYCIVLYCTRVRRVRRIEDNLTINDFRLLTIADSTTSTTTTATTTITGLWAVAFHVVVPFTRLFAIPRVFPAAAMTGFVCTRYIRRWKIISKILKQKKVNFNTAVYLLI